MRVALTLGVRVCGEVIPAKHRRASCLGGKGRQHPLAMLVGETVGYSRIKNVGNFGTAVWTQPPECLGIVLGINRQQPPSCSVGIEQVCHWGRATGLPERASTCNRCLTTVPAETLSHCSGEACVNCEFRSCETGMSEGHVFILRSCSQSVLYFALVRVCGLLTPSALQNRDGCPLLILSPLG